RTRWRVQIPKSLRTARTPESRSICSANPDGARPMRILILGAGEVGLHLARQLSDEGHDVVVVEENPERVRAIADSVDAMVVSGNAAALSTLEAAGVERTDLLLAVTSLDEINLMACLSAAQYQVPIKIARVSKPDYFD